jgi:hypothetical protein
VSWSRCGVVAAGAVPRKSTSQELTINQESRPPQTLLSILWEM